MAQKNTTKEQETKTPAVDPAVEENPGVPSKTTVVQSNTPYSPLPVTPPQNKNLQFLLIPSSIVVAGLLIAVGLSWSNIYVAKNYKTGTGGVQGAVGQQQNAVQPQANPSDLAKKYQPISASDHIKGDPNAPVKIIEYSDLDCPFCKVLQATLDKLIPDYKGKVAWIYRHMPIAGLHPNSFVKSVGAECAAKLGGEKSFWDFIDAYMQVQDAKTGAAELAPLAKKIGLNVSEFNTCLSGSEFNKLITAQIENGAAAGGRGTPYMIIVKGDKIATLIGAYPYEEIKNQVDQLLK
ncbi:MAG: thioredoxin domain-containing protein [bacterium]|nr:thioredoxin domain-containing protein [bacterium]